MEESNSFSKIYTPVVPNKHTGELFFKCIGGCNNLLLVRYVKKHDLVTGGLV